MVDLLHGLELAAVVLALIIAYLKKRDQDTAETRADTILRFFDPVDESVRKPPNGVPGRTWKMSDETKRSIISGLAPDVVSSLLLQIDDAERRSAITYVIAEGPVYFEIEYGLVRSFGKK